MKYYIAKKEHYYAPDPNKHGWVQDPASNDFGFRAAQGFESFEGAKTWIDVADSMLYHREHNEYGRPEYKILDEITASNLDAIWSHEDIGSNYYDWDFCVDPENPTEEEEIEVCNRAAEKAWNEFKNKAVPCGTVKSSKKAPPSDFVKQLALHGLDCPANWQKLTEWQWYKIGYNACVKKSNAAIMQKYDIKH